MRRVLGRLGRSPLDGGDVTTTELTVADVLRQAADLIDEVGLWRGADEPSDDPTRCAISAIYDVIGMDRSPEDTALLHARVTDALKASLGFEKLAQIFRWNDTAPSKEVVTSQLRQAADAVDGSPEQGATP